MTTLERPFGLAEVVVALLALLIQQFCFMVLTLLIENVSTVMHPACLIECIPLCFCRLIYPDVEREAMGPVSPEIEKWLECFSEGDQLFPIMLFVTLLYRVPEQVKIGFQ